MTNQATLPLTDMRDWTFYDDGDELDFAYTYGGLATAQDRHVNTCHTCYPPAGAQ